MIYNEIEACAKGNFRKRFLSDIKGVVVHRIGPEGTHNGVTWSMRCAWDIAKFFQSYKAIGKMAYTFVIPEDGTIEQALPLSYVSPAGKNLNNDFIHVAVVGRIDKKPINANQSTALATLVSFLCRTLGVLDVRGHMETDGASKDLKKDCPGAHLRMQGLRQLVIEKYKFAEPLEGVVL